MTRAQKFGFADSDSILQFSYNTLRSHIFIHITATLK